MKTISLSDKIFATVTICGRVILNLTIEGFSSMRQVISYVSRSISGTTTGMATLTLRNGSQGWSLRQMIRPAAMPEGVQLSLF